MEEKPSQEMEPLYLSAATDIGISDSFAAEAKTGLSLRSASGGIEVQDSSLTVSKGNISLKSYDSIGLWDRVEISASNYLSIYSQSGGFHMYGGHLDAGEILDLSSFGEIELRDGVKLSSKASDLSKVGLRIHSKTGGFAMYDGGFLRAYSNLVLEVHESIELRGDHLPSAESVNVWSDQGDILIESQTGSFTQAEGGSLRAQGNVYVLAKTFVELWGGVDVWAETGGIVFAKTLKGETISSLKDLEALEEGVGVYGVSHAGTASALSAHTAVWISS